MLIAAADPDLQIRRRERGGRVFGSSQPDPEMSTGHFGPQFAPKIGGAQAPLLDPPLHSSQGKSLAPNP